MFCYNWATTDYAKLYPPKMLYLPISRSWIVSLLAQRVYLVCALSALALLGIVIGTLMAVAAAGGDSFAVSPLVARALRVLLWPCVVGTAALTIAMWYFWFSFDDSDWLKKSLWFVLLYLVIVIGPVLYYFFVYRSGRALDRAHSEA